MLVFALEERKLIDRTSRYTDRAGAGTIEWHPVERRTLFRLLAIPRPISRPHVNRLRRDIEHSTGRSQYRGRIAFEIILRQVAYRDRVQRQAVVRVDLTLRAVHACGRNYPLKFAGRGALVPLPHGGKLRRWVVAVWRQVKWRVEDQFAADQAARIVARRIIVVRAQMISRSIAEIAGPIDVE